MNGTNGWGSGIRNQSDRKILDYELHVFEDGVLRETFKTGSSNATGVIDGEAQKVADFLSARNPRANYTIERARRSPRGLYFL